MTCPACGRDVWLYDSNTWTCRDGHHTPVGASLERVAEPDPKLPRTVGLPILMGAAGALIFDGIHAVVNAL